ncbi:MAG: hypothetical protein HKP58_01845 [Desulfatitalea sp.]|nr:hypothetical protein [Desulfatitalea sp.]NNJ99130.1 hypothetical protein [Desulfatitalea sp.]
MKARIQNRLDDEVKTRLRKRIAEILLRESEAGNGDVHPVFHNLLQLLDDKENCRLLLKAADLYQKNHQYIKARQGYKNVLDDIKRINDDGVRELFTKAAIGYSTAIMVSGAFETQEVHGDANVAVLALNEARTKAEQSGDQNAQAIIELQLATMKLLLGKHECAQSHFNRGLSMADGIQDPEIRQEVNTLSTFFLFWQHRFLEIIANYEKFVSDEGKSEVEKYPENRSPLFMGAVLGRERGPIATSPWAVH